MWSLCTICLEYGDCKRCECRGGWYCSKQCQIADYEDHQEYCVAVRHRREHRERLAVLREVSPAIPREVMKHVRRFLWTEAVVSSPELCQLAWVDDVQEAKGEGGGGREKRR